MLRDPVLAAMPLDSLLSRRAAPATSLVSLSIPAPGVAYLRISKFDQVRPAVDRAFRTIDSLRVRTLIIDVRGNPGGDASSLSPLTHLVRERVTAGVMLSNKWYRVHGGPPSRLEMEKIPSLPDSDYGLDLVHTVRASGAVAGVITPRAPYFGGEVYLFIDGRAGSATANVQEASVVTTALPMLAASLIMMTVGFAACFVPARRALAVQPKDALSSAR